MRTNGNEMGCLRLKDDEEAAENLVPYPDPRRGFVSRKGSTEGLWAGKYLEHLGVGTAMRR